MTVDQRRVHLEDIVDRALLEQMIAERYVKVEHHPSEPLRIFNYTAKTQFDKVWNDVTRVCRGLIVDADDFVVARPFAKFFNHGEVELRSSGPVEVTDKMDGSLGILYPTANGFALSTRGRFDSEQARHATALFRERYADRFSPEPGVTYLFEIIFPENRIVVDYDDLDDLVLLAAIDNATGRTMQSSNTGVPWPGPAAETFTYPTLADALAADPRPNAEGLVVRFLEEDNRLKIKQSDYVRLHRLVTDVSERRVWEVLSESGSVDDWLENVPDELYTFVTAARDDLRSQHAALTTAVEVAYQQLVKSLADGWQRKEFADGVAAMSDWVLARALFLRLDGRSFDHLVWNAIRPAEHDPLFSRSEDNN